MILCYVIDVAKRSRFRYLNSEPDDDDDDRTSAPDVIQHVSHVVRAVDMCATCADADADAASKYSTLLWA